MTKNECEEIWERIQSEAKTAIFSITSTQDADTSLVLAIKGTPMEITKLIARIIHEAAKEMNVKPEVLLAGISFGVNIMADAEEDE